MVCAVDDGEFVLADLQMAASKAHMRAPASATGFWPCRALPRAAASDRRDLEHAGKAYKTVRNELEAYEGQLAEKIEIVALNKSTP